MQQFKRAGNVFMTYFLFKGKTAARRRISPFFQFTASATKIKQVSRSAFHRTNSPHCRYRTLYSSRTHCSVCSDECSMSCLHHWNDMSNGVHSRKLQGFLYANNPAVHTRAHRRAAPCTADIVDIVV